MLTCELKDENPSTAFSTGGGAGTGAGTGGWSFRRMEERSINLKLDLTTIQTMDDLWLTVQLDTNHTPPTYNNTSMSHVSLHPGQHCSSRPP